MKCRLLPKAERQTLHLLVLLQSLSDEQDVLIVYRTHLHGNRQLLQSHVLYVDQLLQNLLGLLLSHSRPYRYAQPFEFVLSAHQGLHLGQFLKPVYHQ